MSGNEKTKETSSRPLILEIEDAKAEIVRAVNSVLDRGLSCYIVADILNSVHLQLREGARKELEAARLQEQTQQVK